MSVNNAKSRLDQLEAMRDTLALAIDDCTSSRDLPALVKQLREVLQEIDSLNPVQNQETVAERLKRERNK